MKKLLLFIFALFLWTGAWADKTVWLNPGSFENSGTHSWDEAGAVMYSYVFNNEGHQWIKMTETSTINGVTCYKAEIDDNTYTTLVLVRINPAYADNPSFDNDVKWAQTGDITLSEIADNTLFTITNWGSYSNTGVVNTYTAKFITNKNWTTPKAYAWSATSTNLGNWGGTVMTNDGTYSSLGTSSKKYSISFKAAPAPQKIIFNNGDDPGVEGDTKTGDLTFVDGKTYFLGTEENLAYGATVSWGDDANHTEAINGDATLSNITDGKDETDVQVKLNGDKTVMSVVLDLGEAKTFNSLLINQTGDRWNTSFRIYVSNDNSAWTEVTANTTGVTSGRFIATFTAQTARYLKYVSSKTEKNIPDEWGAGLAEVQLYNFASVPTVASIALSASTLSPVIGDKVTLTTVATSSIDGVKIGLGDITWNNSNTTAGTIADGIYTAKAAGTSEISATYDAVTSNTVTLIVVDAVKIDLTANNAYRIYPIEETLNDGKNNAFDSDADSQWELHKTTADTDAGKTYNTGFIADLGGEYDITNISIKFEGACSKAFGLAFAGTDGVFGEDVYTGGHNDQETHTEEFSGQNVTNARYVKFLSTKATTQWGIKIKDFTIHGIEKSTVTDTENPTITTISEGTITNNSITLNITGNDNDSKYLMYKLEYSGKTSWISGTANAATPAIFEGLLPGKEYSFTITAYDSKGNNVNTNKVVSTTGDPLTLPVATKNTDDVKTIFGQYGKPIDYHVYRASEFAETGWSHNALQTNGNNNNVEMTFTAKDVSDMEYLHLDIYAPSAIPMCVFLQDGSWKGIDIEDGIPAGEWKQVDIPMSFFKGTCERPMTALTNLLICKKVNNTTAHEGHGEYSSPYPYFIIGNIYFWKTPAVDEVKPVMVSAVHESKTYDSATLTLNATDNSGKVKYHIVDAINGVDVTTDLANSGENFEYTVTELYDNTSYNFTVTAVDSKGNVSDNSVVMSTITTDAAPSGQEKVKGTHTVFLIPYHYVNTNVYELIITCEENLTGLGGAYWHTSAGDKAIDLDYVINSDKKSMVIRTESTSNPNMYTPLYVKINGDEVSFDNSITWIEKHADAVSVSVNEWASFSSAKGLDFSNVVGLKAYKVTSNSNTSVSYTSVDEAAANTGLVLNGAQRTYYVPVKTTASSHNDNLLKGTATAAKIITAEEAATNKFYAFGKKAGEIGFVKAAAGYTVHEGKAYLELTNALAANGREFIGLPGAEESETDGINKVNTLVETGVRYNLAGQKVGKDYKGIVIVNGRKVVIK